MYASLSALSLLTAHLSDMILDGPFTPANVLRIECVKQDLNSCGSVTAFHVELSTSSLVIALLSGLRGTHGLVPTSSGPCPKTFVWIPAAILQAALPEMVRKYEAADVSMT